MAKTAYFQGQMIPGAGKPLFCPFSCAIVNGIFASWTLRPKQPIFKVKRTPEHVNPLFFQFSCTIGHEFFGDPEFQSHNFQNFICTSVNPLSIEPIGPHVQNGPFSRSNNFRRSWPSQPKRPIFKVKRSQEQVNPSFCRYSCTIGHGFFGDPEFRPHIFQNFTSTSVKTLPMESVGPHDQKGPFSWLNDPKNRRPLRPYLWSQLAITAKTTHFLDQTIPRAVHEFFGEPKIRPHFCHNITWTSVKFLPMDLVGPHVQNDPFSRLNNPRNRANWHSRPKGPIFKVKRSPEQ
ncbi:hypothetical protein H5410_064085, partial [Solanum commersonii]